MNIIPVTFLLVREEVYFEGRERERRANFNGGRPFAGQVCRNRLLVPIFLAAVAALTPTLSRCARFVSSGLLCIRRAVYCAGISCIVYESNSPCWTAKWAYLLIPSSIERTLRGKALRAEKTN